MIQFSLFLYPTCFVAPLPFAHKWIHHARDKLGQLLSSDLIGWPIIQIWSNKYISKRKAVELISERHTMSCTYNTYERHRQTCGRYSPAAFSCRRQCERSFFELDARWRGEIGGGTARERDREKGRDRGRDSPFKRSARNYECIVQTT